MQSVTPTESIDLAKEKLLKYLDDNGLRRTSERFAILDEIYSRPGHFDAEALYISMRNKNYSVSRATIYNTLEILVDSELIKKHQFGKNLAIYEKSVGSRQHDHLICTDCGRVIEFCDPRLQQIQDMVGELLGFEITQHSLILHGKCNNPHCIHKTGGDKPKN